MRSTRREFVRSGIALFAGLLAGCTGTGSDPATSPGDDSTESPGRDSTPTPSPTASTTPSATFGKSPTATPSETPTERGDTPSPGATPGTEPGPTVLEASLESGRGSCGSTAEAEVTGTDEGFNATGSIVAPTPCYEATLAGYDEEGSTARFHVDVREPPGTPACVQCVGTIPFELRVRTRGAFETVVLDLGGEDPTTIRRNLP